MSVWDSYAGKLPAAVHRQLAEKIGEESVVFGQANGLIGHASKGSRKVALPLWRENGVVGTVLLLDPSGRTEEPTMRISNAEARLPDETPVWLSSVPGGVEAACDAVSGGDLHVSEQLSHVLSFIGKTASKGACIGVVNGINAMNGLVKMLLGLSPFSRPARILYWFPQERFPSQIADLMRDTYTCERRKTPEEAEAQAAAETTSKQDMFLTYTGRIAILGADGVWREAVKGAATNLLVQRGNTIKMARKLVDQLPLAMDYTFDPARTSRVINTPGGTLLNEYRGMPLTPSSGRWSAIWRLINHLVADDPAGREYFLDWIAKPLQSLYSGNGSHRLLSAVVLHGAQGTGKGLLTEILRVIYAEYMLVIGQQNLEDAFEPAKMAKMLFLVANEIGASSEFGSKTEDRLKAWITEERVPIRRMHAAGDEARVHFNMMFTSNRARPVRIEGTDRRYSVWIQHRPLPVDIIQELQAEKAAGWPTVANFLDHLLGRKILREFYRPYDNKARASLMSVDSTQLFAEHLRDNGARAMTADWVLERKAKIRRAEGDTAKQPTAFVQAGTDDSCFIPIKHLAEMYRLWCSSFGHREIKTAGLVTGAITQHVPGTFECNRRLDGVACRGIAGIPIEPAPVRTSDAIEVATPKQTEIPEDWFGVGSSSSTSNGWDA